MQSLNRCLFCGKSLLNRRRSLYCSNKCQKDKEYNEYIKDWKSNIVDGNRGVHTKNISQHIKRYLRNKFRGKCSICGWNMKHLVTGHTPLEVDHKNGNAEDNREENLRLLCPNCHALSLNYRNLNKGKGRKWRKAKYLKVMN